MSESTAIDDAPPSAEEDPSSGADTVTPTGTPARPTGRWWHRVTPPTAPQVFLAGAVLIWTWYFTVRSLNIHHALGTATYDSALYDQGMWLLSQFDAPFVTLMGRNLFGDHTSFVLLFLVPLYWIAPGAWIMFTAQSAAIAAGAIPVFLYAPAPSGFGVVGADRVRHVSAAPGGRLDEPRELPSRRVPRRVRRLRDLRGARTQVAPVRRVRRALAPRQGGRVAGDRAARHLGGDPARSAHRAAHRVRQPRVHGRSRCSW